MKDTKNCSKRVFTGERWDMRGHECGTNATIFRDEKWWCKRHDPQEFEKKMKARKEKLEQQYSADKLMQKQAEQLLKRLKVQGCVEYRWKRGYVDAVVITFDEVERLLKELGR